MGIKKEKMPTLAEMDSFLAALSEDELIEEFRDKEKEKELISQFGVYFDFSIDCKKLRAIKCPHCGKISVISEQCNGMIYTCQKCLTKSMYVSYGKHAPFSGWGRIYRYEVSCLADKNHPYCCKKYDNKFLLFRMRPYAIAPKNKDRDCAYIENDPNDWLFETRGICYEIEDKILFTKKSGFKSPDRCKSGFMSLNASNIGTQISTAGDSVIIMNNDAKELIAAFNEGMAEIDPDYNAIERKNPKLQDLIYSYNDTLLKNQEKRRAANKKEELDTTALLGDWPAEEIREKVLANVTVNPCKVVSMNGTLLKYVTGCVCGESIVQEKKLERADELNYKAEAIEFPCPKCGRKIKISLSTGSLTDSYSNWSYYLQPIKGGVAMRCGKVTLSINTEKMEIEISPLEEYQRILFYPKKMQVWKMYKPDKKWEKARVSDITYHSSYDPHDNKDLTCGNTEEELLDIIHNSFLSRTGIEQAWGLGDYKDYQIEPKGKVFWDSFIIAWYKNPYIEMTIKSKLKSITTTLIRAGAKYEFEKGQEPKNIYELYGITKKVLKMARERDVNINYLMSIKRLCEVAPSFDLATWDRIIGENLNPDYFADACVATETTPTRLFEYLQSCYDNQCIEKAATLVLFKDYYRMAKAIGFNISDSHIKFPSSLKKEHDKATFAYRVVQNELQKKMFSENSEKNKIYEYSNKQFVVIIPQTADEVVREGQLQHHCVASYVSRIERGDTCICFLRKREDISKPYFTCEIFKDSLYQVKGFSNRYPRENEDPGLIEFLNEWAKKKKLSVDYMNH